MAGKDNLRPGGFEKDRKAASEAGKKSGEARRKKKLITDYLKDLLEKEMELNTSSGNTVKATGAEHIATVIMKKALKGDMTAIREYIDRIEGKSVARHEVTGRHGNPLTQINMNVDADEMIDFTKQLNEMLDD